MSLDCLTANQFEEAINLQYGEYKKNHRSINPLSESITIKNWKKIIDKELLQDNSYILIENGNIVSYLFCYKVDETTIGVSYTGSRLNTIKRYNNFLYNVVVQLFNKYKIIELEIDDCDTSANLLAELFTYKTSLSWDTYIKDLI